MLVLVFITAIALVIGSLQFGATTAEKATVVTAGLTDAYYAVDSGVEFGISKVREANGLCPAIDLPASAAHGQDVTVTCSGADSEQAPQGTSGYAVVTFDPGPGSLSSQSGNGVQKQVSGRTYVNGGFDLKSKLRANSAPPDPASPTYPLGDGLGYVYQSNAACGPHNNLITPNYKCTPLTVQQVDPKPALPTAKPPTRSSAPAQTTVSGGVTCGIFLPGTYGVASSSGTPANPNPLGLLAGAPNTANYLASGVYYFENLGQINLNNFRLFAGDGGGDPKTLSPAPCSNDAMACSGAWTTDPSCAGVKSGDKGVQIILGGTSWLNIDQADAEFMAYRPAAGSAGRGVSIRTVPNTGAGPFTTSSLAAATNGDALTVASGNNPHLAVHGLVYAPNANVSLNDTNTSAAQILGGVMAWDLDMNASASAGGLVVQVTGSRPRSRSKVIIEASVAVTDTKMVKAHAIVDVHVDPASRTISDAGTHSNMSITAGTAQFKQTDVGASIFGGTIPSATYITQYLSSTSILISKPATATASPVEITIDPSTRTVTDAALVAGSTTVTSAAAGFTSDDVGASIVSLATTGACKDGLLLPGTSIVSAPPTTATKSVLISQAACASQVGATVSVTHRRISVTVDSWRVENP